MSEQQIKAVRTISIKDLKLPTISEQGKKALDIINSSNLNFTELESALSADPVLMAIILKYANSPMYRARVEAKNLRQALNLLGVDIVKSAILICTMRSFTEPLNPAKELLWEQVVKLSAMSKLIARQINRKLADEIELTAMMSEIGGLVLSSNFSEEYMDVMARASEKKIPLVDEELYTFGLKRVDVTTETLVKLRLPENTVEVLNGYFENKTPDVVETNIDKQLVVLRLAYFFIAYRTKPELIKKDSKCLSLIELLDLQKMNIDQILERYNESLSESFWF